MPTNRRKIFSGIWVVMVFFAASAWATSPAPITMSPSKLSIGSFFAGKDVRFSGKLQPKEEIVIEIVGPKNNAEFHIKERVGGLWMNHGKVEFESAPFLYALLLPETRGMEPKLANLPIGMKYLQKSIALHPEGLNQKKLFEQFFQLKRSQRLYDRRNGAVHYRTITNAEKAYETTFHFPSSTIPGNYQIITTVIKESGKAAKSTHIFKVEEAGIVKYVHGMARNQGLIYGILSVVIALLVGAAIGVFFKQSGAH